MFILFLDDDGKVIRSWKIDKGGKQKQTPAVDTQQDRFTPIDFGDASTAKVKLREAVIADGEELEVWLLIRSTREEPHLKLEAYVGNERRAVVDITRLPVAFVVTPTDRQAVIFHVVEANNDLGAQVTSPGWRCELSQVEKSDAFVVLCHKEA